MPKRVVKIKEFKGFMMKLDHCKARSQKLHLEFERYHLDHSLHMKMVWGIFTRRSQL